MPLLTMARLLSHECTIIEGRKLPLEQFLNRSMGVLLTRRAETCYVFALITRKEMRRFLP